MDPFLLHAAQEFFFNDENDNVLKYHHNLTAAYNVLIQTSVPRDSMPKITNYMNVASDMALLQNVDDFKLHYRVTRQTFEVILCEVATDLLHENVGGASPVAPDRQILVFLNYVTNQHSMRNCGHFYGMSISTVHGIISSVTDALLKLQKRVSLSCHSVH